MGTLRSILPVVVLLCRAPSALLGLETNSTFEAFGRDQGISGSSVTGIVQDSKGFLWLSTQSGLNRWDGYTMRVWQKEPFSKNTLSHNLVQTMTLDKGVVLWLGTYGGLDRFDTVTETFQSFRHIEGNPTSLSHNVVTRVFRDAQGALWVGTLDGLNRLDEDKGVFRVYPYSEGASNGLAGKTVRTLVNDASGRLWVGSSGGLNLYDSGADKLLRMDQLFPRTKFPAGAVMASYRSPDERSLWLAVWGQGLVRFDPDTGESTTFPLQDQRLFSLGAGEAGQLLVGTWGGGLIVFQTDTGKQFALKHDATRVDTLSHDVVYGTFQDASGVIWVATNGGAVSRYNPKRKQYQSFPLPGKVPFLFEDASQTLWAGVYNGGLVRIDADGKTKTWKHDPKNPRSLTDDIVNGITQDPKGRLWVLTNRGVSIVDPKTGTVTPWSTDPSQPGSLPDEVVNGLTIDHQGRYWFSTYRSGVVRMGEPGTGQPVAHYVADPKVAGSLPDNLVYFVYEDRKHRVWVGTNGGLGLYQPATDDFRVWRYNPEDRSGLPSNTVRSILEDHTGRLWLVTNGGGLSLVDTETGALKSYGLHDGLTSLSIYSAQEDSLGQFWINSANGLFSFRPEAGTFRRFGLADGLPSAEFSSGSLRRKNGQIVFGGLAGIVTLVAEHLSTSEPPPAVALTSILVGGQPRLVTNHLTLGWQDNVVTFTMAVLDFRNPGKNSYAHKLEGFDPTWVQAGNGHEVTYTNLWPGTYKFRFRGANPADSWTEASETVLVTVEAAPWLSWYAWILYALLAIGLVFLYQKAMASQTLGRKVNELEVLRHQLEEANIQLDRLARLDGLTGIPNRRALDTWLVEEWNRAQRQSLSVAALIVDIDDFKRYNDYYGHLAGDTCLKVVAQSLSSHLHRNSDFCARFGGEEFVVLLHDTDLEGARVVASRMLEAIDGLKIPHQMATAIDTVSISVGVAAQVPQGHEGPSALLHAADQALYRAKALGRHRVEAN